MKTTDFLGNEWEIDCMGCAISKKEMLVPGGMIQRTKYFCVHQDPLIPIPGFLVIASVRHISSISEMHDLEFEDFSTLVKTTHKAIKEVTKVEYLTLIQEESSRHFHLWFFPWTKSVIEKYGTSSLSKIREIMIDFRRQPIRAMEWEELENTIEQMKLLIDQ
jgi:diadenosine tetraphosphate (Ap4A) HIT family hydrolase